MATSVRSYTILLFKVVEGDRGDGIADDVCKQCLEADVVH